MAQLFVEDCEKMDWAIVPLTDAAYAVSDKGVSAIADTDGSIDEAGPPALLVRRDLGAQEHWLLLARKNAHLDVNGAPLALGARLLCDRDEIVVRGKDPSASLHGFFSTERQPEIVPFPASGGEVRCPRCKQPLDPGRPAVRCPNPDCGIWHHEDQERSLLCWSYADTCTLCPQPTHFDGGFRWTPEQL